MKIVCDACQAKYSIADEKIQGKAFKIRCKKCNHIIVVKTSGAGAAAATSTGADKPKSAAAAAAAPAAAPASSGEAVWHVVVDGEQAGPLNEAEVKDKLQAGQINGDSLVWKEGFADWTALSSVPDLVALQSKAQPSTGRPMAHEPARPAAAAGSVARTTPSPASTEQADVFAAATIVTPANPDAFSAVAAAPTPQAVPSAVAPAPSSPFLFGGAPAAAAEPAVVIKNPGNGAGGTHLTGQRNENSVLFSLSNLEALAVPSSSGGARSPSSSSNTEGSGLIDIRSMAAMTLHEGGPDGRRPPEALPTFSTPQFSPVAPVLLPISSSGPPKWVYPVLGLLAVGILVLGYGIYRVMASPPPGNPIVIQQVAPAPVAPAPAAAPVAAAPAPAAPSAATPEAKPVVEERPAAAEEKQEKPGKGGKHHKGESKGDKKGADTAVAAADARGKKASAADTKAKAKELGDLLGDGGKKEEPAKPAAPQVKLVTLTQSDIVNAMKGVQPRVQACANQYKVPGTAMANISVASGGKVTGATVTGKFAGTPTGSCIETAAKSAKFPACQGMNFPWPFTLSPR